ncbi:MAG TPA: GtrA family protein [Lacisediminihabitans sp.]|uniref:GtrA family protein n=1 Tax=Lacisediminihabitans sp. TaxID=2787631 RepID=UPI002ED8D4FF
MPQFSDKQRRTAWQAFRYLASAGSVSLVYLGLLALGLLLGWQYFLAILAAQVVTIALAFPVYRVFVFQSRGSIRIDFVRFLSVWSAGAIAGIVFTPLLVEFAHLDPFVAQVISIVVVSVGSFVSHRFFSFRTSSQVKASESSAPARDEERHS